MISQYKKILDPIENVTQQITRSCMMSFFKSKPSIGTIQDGPIHEDYLISPD